MSRFKKVKDGETHNIDYKNQYALFACCDCGLVHAFDFEVVDGMLEFTAWRDDRATGQLRRNEYGRLHKDVKSKWKLVRAV